MNKLILTATAKVLAKRAWKSVTSWIGAAAAGGGIWATLDPSVQAMVPPQYRPLVVAVGGVLVILSRHRQDIEALYKALKAEALAVVAETKAATAKQDDTQ